MINSFVIMEEENATIVLKKLYLKFYRERSESRIFE